jgi:L-lactate dehydrogenase complex protein LldG
MLGRIRSALGRNPGQLPDALRDPRLMIRETEDRVELFCAAVEKLGGTAQIAASYADACARVGALAEGRRAVASNSNVLRDCGIPLLSAVEQGLPVAEADIGITSADYALADTGTLVLLSSGEEARMISLLPPTHVAVVPRDRILSGLDELFTVIPNPAELTSAMVLITGPSRTGDIEQILVRGVHGPGHIHVIVI